MMKKRILSLLLVLMLLSMPALAQVCALCGGDDVCDTCAGSGYLLMQAYGSNEQVKIACSAGCDNGSCPDCTSCAVCGGLGYLTMQAYGSDQMVKVACTAENCSAGAQNEPALEPGLPLEEEVAPAGTMLLVSPAEYTDGRVFIDEDSSSWMYSTTGTFDMDAYIDRLCEEYDMSLKRVNEVGDCIFYDLDYRHLETGSRHTLSMYTFSGGEKFDLSVIKPSAGGISLPEFVDGAQPAVQMPVDVPDTLILLPSPAEYTNGKVYLDESSSSWMYSTTEDFDMDAYIKRLCNDCGMEIQEISETGSCIFYDLYYTHPQSGKRMVLCMYTFTGTSKVELSVIKPSGGGIALPEFYGQEAVTSKPTPKTTPKPTAKPASDNRFENAMDAYLRNH